MGACTMGQVSLQRVIPLIALRHVRSLEWGQPRAGKDRETGGNTSYCSTAAVGVRPSYRHLRGKHRGDGEQLTDDDRPSQLRVLSDAAKIEAKPTQAFYAQGNSGGRPRGRCRLCLPHRSWSLAWRLPPDRCRRHSEDSGWRSAATEFWRKEKSES